MYLSHCNVIHKYSLLDTIYDSPYSDQRELVECIWDLCIHHVIITYFTLYLFQLQVITLYWESTKSENRKYTSKRFWVSIKIKINVISITFQHFYYFRFSLRTMPFNQRGHNHWGYSTSSANHFIQPGNWTLCVI